MNTLPNLKDELKQEYETTAKFIENFPEGKNEYAPHEKSMKLMPLAIALMAVPTAVLAQDPAALPTDPAADWSVATSEHRIAVEGGKVWARVNGRIGEGATPVIIIHGSTRVIFRG